MCPGRDGLRRHIAYIAVPERDVFGKKIMLFEKPDRERLEPLGDLHTPSVADLFVAKVKGAMT